ATRRVLADIKPSLFFEQDNEYFSRNVTELDLIEGIENPVPMSQSSVPVLTPVPFVIALGNRFVYSLRSSSSF
ncbi:MAG TPA: hypothetical protein DIW81_14975, partial [Planctomycetaceae bacterium]|nr:hypothetical protein [Planctomycetaceae bacterium]